MRETSFIKQNKGKWQEFEQILDGQQKDPDKLNDLFIQVTDDLSYSRTFYPNRSVRVYLNGLAQRVFFSIYKNRRSKASRLISFWTDELPQLFYQTRRDFLFAFLIFALSTAIGALSCAMDPDFAAVILGDSYVEMTRANIESGDPMAVYKEKGKFGMTVGITANNLFVAFLTFVMGVFFSIGSIAIMVQNGIMLGAFQYFFLEEGLFRESFLTIWIHGTLEISAIIIAGAAGITMGKGLVFPGTYTRLQSFQRSARRGVKIMMGLIPIIMLAGFFEGYLTRHTDTPDIVRALFILGCFAFVVFYFIWYPFYKARKGFDTQIRDTKIPPNHDQKINFQNIKSSGEIFSDIFVFYNKYIGKLAFYALITSTLFTLMAFLLNQSSLTGLFYFPTGTFNVLESIGQFFINSDLPLLWLINTLVFGFLIYGVFTLMEHESGLETSTNSTSAGKKLLTLAKALLGAFVFQMIISTNDWYTIFMVLFLFPVLFIWIYVNHVEKLNPIKGFGRTIALQQKSFGICLGLYVVLFFLSILFFSLTDTLLLWFYLNLIGWVIHFEEAVMEQISSVVLTFISIYVMHLILTMVLIGFSLLYYSLLETKEAGNLKKKVQMIGAGKKLRGLEKE